MSLQANIYSTQVASWGESPVWWQDTLYYVDIKNSRIHYITENQEDYWQLDVTTIGEVGFVTPTTKQQQLLVGGNHGLFLFDTVTRQLQFIADPETTVTANRFNDGKVSPDSILFAGTISTTKQTGTACLYRVDSNNSWQITTAYQQVTNSNGLAWNLAEKRMYYIDTPTRAIKIFHYENGVMGKQIAEISTQHIDASPDGMTIDSAGTLWVAFCHGSCVAGFDSKKGNEVARITLPCREVTSCCFGGDNYQSLYISTGVDQKLTEEGAGNIWRVDNMPAPGLAATACPYPSN